MFGVLFVKEELRKRFDFAVQFVVQVRSVPNASMICFNYFSTHTHRSYAQHKQAEKHELLAAIKADAGTVCKVLAVTIPFGIAYHHAGLTSDERRHIEDAFRRNVLCVICCTSTLAAGVNLPAKRVIIRSPYIGRDFITLSRYKQMVGRAGRAGMGNGTGESIVICAQRDNARMAELLCSPMDEAASGMHADDLRGLRALILSVIGLKLATCLTELETFVGKTLMASQAKRLGITVRDEIRRAVRQLMQMKVLTIAESDSSVAATVASAADVLSDSSVVFNTEDMLAPSSEQCHASTSSVAIETIRLAGRSTSETTSKESKKSSKKKQIFVKPSTSLEINALGRAAYKSCIDLNKAQVIYNDLQEAQKSLVLIDYLHLLYIVTPCEPADINVYPDMGVYYAQVSYIR